jgi:Rrf2 family protein
MRLSNASSYAIHSLVHMAAKKNSQLVPSHLIAREQGIPERFLLKVLRPLVNLGILRSVKGPNGGYRLARAPKDISLLEIVEAVDGPIRGHISFEGDGTNRLEKKLQVICDQAAETVRRQLQKVRLSDLAR